MMKRLIPLVYLAVLLTAPAYAQTGADYDTLSEMAAEVTASDFFFLFDASEADGSRMKKKSFDATATNCLTGLGTFVAFAPALGADDNYVTDAEKTVIGNTSGTNSGDQTTITGNAGTATALAANGGNCDAGSYALGVDASGASEGCTAAPTAASLAVDDLITLSGVAEGAANLGLFTGSTIADNSTVKAAIQALETFVETLGGGVDFTAYDDVTWGAAAGGSQTHTFDTGAGTDPAMMVSDTAFTFNKPVSTTGVTIPGTAAGGQYMTVLEDTDLGTSASGWGVYGDLAHATVFAIPLAAPAGQVMAFAAPGNQTMADSTIQSVSVGTWILPLVAADINTPAELETVGGLGAFFSDYADDADASTMRTTLGLAIGTNVQAYDADLDAWAAITPSTGNVQTTGIISGRLGEIIKTSSTTLTTAETNGQLLSNYGETDDADLILTSHDIDTFPGNSFVYNIVTTMSTNDTCFKAAADNLINFDGTNGTDNGCVCNASPTLGNKLTCYALTTGASVADWFCEGTRGTWVAVADNTGDCPD